MTGSLKTNPEQRMGVLQHLRELRKRLLLAVIGVAVGGAVGWFLFDPVMAYLQRPLQSLTGRDPQLNFQTIGAAFDLRVTVAIWLGVIISSPWWILQIAMFIGPGLRRSEKMYAAAFGSAGVLLFLAGSFAGLLVIPQAVDVLLAFTPQDAATLLRADSFVSFCMHLVLAFGFSFLVPELLVALNFVGIVSVRSMLRAWRWAVVLCFTFAAIINPLPSPIPMILQALALLALYFLAVGISALHERHVRRRVAATDVPDAHGLPSGSQ